MIKNGGKISSLKSENLITKENKVYLTNGLIRELRDKGVGIAELRSIAEIFEWSYIPRKSLRTSKGVRNQYVIEADLDDFIQKILQTIGA